MNKRALAYALIVAVVATGAYFLLSRYLVSRLDGTGGGVVPTESGLETYGSSTLGVSFKYPSTRYDIETHAEKDLQTIVLLPEGYVPPVNGEGPPSIAIQVFNNSKNEVFQAFLQNEPRTNFSMSGTYTTVADREALSYDYSGLYESDAVAVAANKRVYVFSASWVNADDQTRQDLQDIISSVKFTDAH